MAPVAKSKFGTPMFEPDVLRKEMSCIEESTCDIVGIFRHPENCSPLPSAMAFLATPMSRTNFFGSAPL